MPYLISFEFILSSAFYQTHCTILHIFCTTRWYTNSHSTAFFCTRLLRARPLLLVQHLSRSAICPLRPSPLPTEQLLPFRSRLLACLCSLASQASLFVVAALNRVELLRKHRTPSLIVRRSAIEENRPRSRAVSLYLYIHHFTKL